MLVVNLVESFENTFLFFCRDSLACVAHLDIELFVLLHGTHSYTSSICIFECIGEEIVQYQFKILAVDI